MKLRLALSLLIVFTVVTLLTSCNEEERVVNTTLIKLLPTEQTVISVSPADHTWTFTSRNNNIASVNREGMVTGNYVGKTTIIAVDINGISSEIDVEVVATTTLYHEPYLNFYANDSVIMSYEERELAFKGQFSDGGTYLLFKPDNECYNGIMYKFDKDNRYIMCEVLIYNNYKDVLNRHLDERYLLTLKNYGRCAIYATPDSTADVYRTEVDNWDVNIYLPKNYTSDIYMYLWNLPK